MLSTHSNKHIYDVNVFMHGGLFCTDNINFVLSACVSYSIHMYIYINVRYSIIILWEHITLIILTYNYI